MSDWSPDVCSAYLIPMALTTQQAVDAGISSIEHLDYAYNAGAKDEAAIAADFAAGRIDRAEANRRLDASFDRDTAMAAYRRFAAKGVFVTPTLNGSRIIAYLDRDDHSKDERSEEHTSELQSLMRNSY